MLFLEYPPCSTCKKARAWLEKNGVEFEARHIKQDNPTIQELDQWQQLSGLPLKKFFNTSGQLYRSLGLKDRLDSMSRQEQLELLAGDGMLVKRPLIIGEEQVLVGFKEAQWKEKLL